MSLTLLIVSTIITEEPMGKDTKLVVVKTTSGQEDLQDIMSHVPNIVQLSKQRKTGMKNRNSSLLSMNNHKICL